MEVINGVSSKWCLKLTWTKSGWGDVESEVQL